MDPASAIIGFVSFGLAVFNKVDEIVRTLKGAKEDLQALRDRSADAEVLLLAIQHSHHSFQPYSSHEAAYFGRLYARAQKYLGEVDAFADKVLQPSVVNGRDGKIKKLQWMLKRRDFDDVLQKMQDLESALNAMLGFLNL